MTKGHAPHSETKAIAVVLVRPDMRPSFLELISKLISQRDRAKSSWIDSEVDTEGARAAARARRRTEVRRERIFRSEIGPQKAVSPTTQSHGLCSRSQPIRSFETSSSFNAASAPPSGGCCRSLNYKALLALLPLMLSTISRAGPKWTPVLSKMKQFSKQSLLQPDSRTDRSGEKWYAAVM